MVGYSPSGDVRASTHQIVNVRSTSDAGPRHTDSGRKQDQSDATFRQASPPTAASAGSAAVDVNRRKSSRRKAGLEGPGFRTSKATGLRHRSEIVPLPIVRDA